jgi:hypothetical protein
MAAKMYLKEAYQYGGESQPSQSASTEEVMKEK